MMVLLKQNVRCLNANMTQMRPRNIDLMVRQKQSLLQSPSRRHKLAVKSNRMGNMTGRVKGSKGHLKGNRKPMKGNKDIRKGMRARQIARRITG